MPQPEYTAIEHEADEATMPKLTGRTKEVYEFITAHDADLLANITAKRIVQEGGIPKSSAYHALDRLTDLGLVFKTPIGYRINQPDRLLIGIISILEHSPTVRRQVLAWCISYERQAA